MHTYKVGDKVRVIDAGGSAYSKIGDILTVKEVNAMPGLLSFTEVDYALLTSRVEPHVDPSLEEAVAKLQEEVKALQNQQRVWQPTSTSYGSWGDLWPVDTPAEPVKPAEPDLEEYVELTNSKPPVRCGGPYVATSVYEEAKAEVDRLMLRIARLDTELAGTKDMRDTNSKLTARLNRREADYNQLLREYLVERKKNGGA